MCRISREWSGKMNRTVETRSRTEGDYPPSLDRTHEVTAQMSRSRSTSPLPARDEIRGGASGGREGFGETTVRRSQTHRASTFRRSPISTPTFHPAPRSS